MTEPGQHISEPITLAYAKCAEIVRARARNFYYGLRLTPEPKRSAIYSVYAWMRQADDEADAAGDPAEKKARLAAYRSRTEQVISSGRSTNMQGDYVWTALAETIRAFRVDPSHLRSMLDGLDTDIDHESRAASGTDGKPTFLCRSRSDLEQYCFRVASTVGLICITIWGLKPGVDEAVARRLAIQRGLAFQMTNILRDFAPDFDEGRVYLAEEDFRASGITPDELRHWSDAPSCRAFVKRLSSWTRTQYVESSPLDHMIDPGCYATLRTMTRIYSGLLTVIETDPARIAGRKRIRLQSMHKAGIALRACARAWVNQHVSASSSLYAVLTPAARR
ncbi:MAG: squalene/phytoene synthase family protein [Phycisphaerae bacterium]|nr:squalene/phytoene synthase family protein [Phycisphaerae bacterium]